MSSSGHSLIRSAQLAAKPDQTTSPSTAAIPDRTWRLRLDAWREDAMALGILFVLITVVVVFRWIYDNWLIDPDIYTMFLPWFGWIGDRLRDGELPVWMPNFFGGSAMIGNPSAGWLYLPMMLIFPFFNVLSAYKLMVAAQLLIGSVALYALVRRIGLMPVAALAATMVYTFGTFSYQMTRYLVIAGQTNTFIPVALLGTEMSLRSRRLAGKLGWSMLTGVALVQIFAAWPSQGIMYAGIWIATWALFRMFMAPVAHFDSLKNRIIDAVITGAGTVFAFFGAGAAAILPLISYSSQSSIPSGDYSHVLGSDYAADPRSISTLFYYFTADNFSIRAEGYGVAILLMVVMGIILTWRQPATAYFTLIFVFGASLCLEHSPTRWLLDLFPPFYHINSHRPIAVIWVLTIAPAFLVGALIHHLARPEGKRIPQRALWAIFGFSFFILGITNQDSFRWIGWFSAFMMLATILLFAALSLDLPKRFDRWKPQLPRFVVLGLVALIFIFPTGGDIVRTVIDPIPVEDKFNGRLGNDPELNAFIERGMARTDPGTAAEFLQNQQELLAPFRYTAYSGAGYPDSSYMWIYNSYWWSRQEPGTQAVLANGRALRLGLDQTSGYNPVQLMDMYQYINAMNGALQDYHWGDVYASVFEDREHGLQLLSMLNCRYILVDRAIPENRVDHQAIRQMFTEVYRDDDAIVYENPYAFERAWLVHDLRPTDDSGLGLLAANEVNGRTTAYVDVEDGESLPVVQMPDTINPDGKVPGESVVISNLTEETMTLEVTAVTDAWLVVSAAYAKGWYAYIDGEKSDVTRTDYALQGVFVPAGTHTVELKYEPRSLRIGLLGTGGTSIAITGIWIWALIDWRRRGREPEAEHRPLETPGGSA